MTPANCLLCMNVFIYFSATKLITWSYIQLAHTGTDSPVPPTSLQRIVVF